MPNFNQGIAPHPPVTLPPHPGPHGTVGQWQGYYDALDALASQAGPPAAPQFGLGAVAQDFIAVAGDDEPAPTVSYDAQVSYSWNPTPSGHKKSKQIYIEPEDGRTVMNINTTKCSKIVQYRALPDDVPNVAESYKMFVDKVSSLGLDLPASATKFPTIEKGGDTLVGIEIELEGWHQTSTLPALNTPETYQYLGELFGNVWNTTTDSSLRNGGREMVSLPGLKAKDAPKALALLKLWFLSYQNNVEVNYRCGTHIHLNVREFTVEQLINLTCLYILFEDLFYRVSGERYKNIFCVPIRASSAQLEHLFRLVHIPKPSYDQFRSIFKYFKKYMAFNLLPAGRYDVNPGGGPPIGTVEFRHHKGESGAFALSRWLQYCLDIHQFAQQISFPDLRKEIFDLNTESNYLAFAQSVFTKLPTNLTQEDISRDMYEGSSTIKELYLISKGTD